MIVSMDSYPVLIYIIISLAFYTTTNGLKASNEAIRKFPENFVFGVSTAAYQIEGAWNVSGKGENIWDKLTHSKPDMIYDKSNGDIACDSYYQYDKDIEMLKELGVNFYRFSLSWSRILPTGSVANINSDGVKYYNKLIDGLLKNNVIPFVTIYHWDLPQFLQELGGWTNPLVQDFYEDYADLVFSLFGDRVKHWTTFNEPKQICLDGYGSEDGAPAVNMAGVGEYLCGHNLLISHARVFHLYDTKYRSKQQGIIGITIETRWGEPSSSSNEDTEAAERFMQFEYGWFLNPIFSSKGDYPKVMKERIAERSAAQKFHKSRLPKFTNKDLKMIHKSADFLGLNFYSSVMTSNPTNSSIFPSPSYWDDLNVNLYFNASWPGSASSWLKVTPWAFYKMLIKIRNDYDNPEIIVTENGYSSWGGLADNDRIRFLNSYLNSLLDAIEEGSLISAYSVWSLMDNFEWMRGYSEKFGLYEIDFNSPNRKRHPRKSAKYYAKVISTRSITREDPEIYELKTHSNIVYI